MGWNQPKLVLQGFFAGLIAPDDRGTVSQGSVYPHFDLVHGLVAAVILEHLLADRQALERLTGLQVKTRQFLKG